VFTQKGSAQSPHLRDVTDAPLSLAVDACIGSREAIAQTNSDADFLPPGVGRRSLGKGGHDGDAERHDRYPSTPPTHLRAFAGSNEVKRATTGDAITDAVDCAS
jgi:hypothetical protein